MTEAAPGSYRQIVVDRQRQLDELISQEVFKPFFVHQFVLFTVLALLALAIPIRESPVGKGTRALVCGLILAAGIDTIRNRRATLGACGYVVGLTTVWYLLWCATLLVFHDVEKDFKRIERRPTPAKVLTDSRANGNRNPAASNGAPHSILDEDDNRTRSNGTALRRRIGSSHTVGEIVAASHLDTGAESKATYAWQPYPRELRHRLNWLLGLILNMRGPEWNWRISSFDPLPQSVYNELYQTDSPQGSAVDDTLCPSTSTRLKRASLTFLKSYIALDVLKVLMMRDPYFVGVVPGLDHPPPSFPFNYFAAFPMFVRSYRLCATALGVYFALTIVTTLNSLGFLGLATVSPGAARTLTSTPLDAPWLYSEAFGSFRPSILDNGLAGCWGQWWHQLFRFGFLSTSRWILSILPSGLSTRSDFRQLTHTMVAFILSGLIHAVGSYTQIADTKPLSGPFLFFILQIPGISIQTFLNRALLPRICGRSLPRNVQRVLNLAYVMAWFMLIGGLIADDFARGGVWLTEPIPISPLRGLGLGAEGEGWWVWGGPWFRWYGAGAWWNSGIQIL